MKNQGQEAERDRLIIIIRVESTCIIEMKGEGESTVGVVHLTVRIHLRAARVRIEDVIERGAGVVVSLEGARHLRSIKKSVGLWIIEAGIHPTQESRA
jgi:hypothetical protein